MLKDINVGPMLAPMPVLMIATYGDDGTVDVMNMAWGGVCDTDKVSLNISENHRTTRNILARRAFTLSVADAAHMREADFFGIATGNKMADKFERSGLTAVRSGRVDAPVVQEFPVTLECEVIEAGQAASGFHVVGRIVGVLADESVLAEDGKPDISKVDPLVFDQYHNTYRRLGDEAGKAWDAGLPLMG